MAGSPATFVLRKQRSPVKDSNTTVNWNYIDFYENG